MARRHAFRNRKRFHLKMSQLAPAVKAELEAAIRESAIELVLKMKAAAPEHLGDLRRSIRAYPLRLRREASWRVAAGDEAAFYARMVEFGTPRNAANPFFYTSYRTSRARIRRRYAAAVRRAVKKVVRR